MGVFYKNTSLKTVHIPPTLKKVDKSCFAYCEALEEVIGMKNTQIEWVGDEAFKENKKLKVSKHTRGALLLDMGFN